MRFGIVIRLCHHATGAAPLPPNAFTPLCPALIYTTKSRHTDHVRLACARSFISIPSRASNLQSNHPTPAVPQPTNPTNPPSCSLVSRSDDLCRGGQRHVACWPSTQIMALFTSSINTTCGQLLVGLRKISRLDYSSLRRRIALRENFSAHTIASQSCSCLFRYALFLLASLKLETLKAHLPSPF